MSMLISQDRHDAQKHNLLYFISDSQLFKLTAHDMKSALVKEVLENHGSQTTPGTSMSNFTTPLSSAPTRSPIHLVLAPFKKAIKSDDTPQAVDKSHLSNSTSTSTNLNETCPLNMSCDHLFQLDPPSLSSELQDNSIVESIESESVPDLEGLLELDSTSVSSEDTSSIEIEFLPEFEGQLDHPNLSPIDVFPEHHDYELFLVQKEIDTPFDNPSHQDPHAYEEQDQDVILSHVTTLSHTFAQPQFMAQHKYEDLDPTDTPSTVPTALQPSSDHTFNPRCVHNPMATQCNLSLYPNLNHNFALPQFMAQHNCEDQEPTDTPITVPATLQLSSDLTFSPMCAHNLMTTECNQIQYLTSLNKMCAHIPFASQNNQVRLSNSLASHTHRILGSMF